jgi:hypothetical protein
MQGALELPLVYHGRLARMRVSPSPLGGWSVVADIDGEEVLRTHRSSWQAVERLRLQLERELEPEPGRTPRRRGRVFPRAAMLLLAVLVSMPAAAQPLGDPNLAFQRHVADYVTLRDRARKDVAPERILDPRIRAISGALLAARIRKERGEAGPGDIIPTALADIIRDRLWRAFDPTEIDVLLTERYPAGLPEEPPLVNQHYGNRLAVAPPVSVLSAVPPVPGMLGYRLIGRALVLWDEEAEIVLDVIPDALPEPHIWDFLDVSSIELRHRIHAALVAAHLDPHELIDDMARDAEAAAAPPVVDEPFDWGVGACMPPSLLLALPPLPRPLEYRLVGPALVVIDIKSGVVRGILWDALTPAPTRDRSL